VAVHSLYAHENRRDALPLTFVRCWPTTLTAGFNDGRRKIAATVNDPANDGAARPNDGPTIPTAGIGATMGKSDGDQSGSKETSHERGGTRCHISRSQGAMGQSPCGKSLTL